MRKELQIKYKATQKNFNVLLSIEVIAVNAFSMI